MASYKQVDEVVGAKGIQKLNSEVIYLDGLSLTLDDAVKISRSLAFVALGAVAIKKIKDSRDAVAWLVNEKIPTYGVNTGFGVNSRIAISFEDTLQLQENIIRSHSATAGEPYADEIVRATMLLRLNCFCSGYSGVSLELAETLVNMLNKNVVPVVHDRGSVGSSGDLAPLAEMSLPIIGLGKAKFNGQILSGKEAMDLAGIPIRKLEYKEGLALTNGFQFGTAIGALALFEIKKITKISDVLAAMFVEALKGVSLAFDEELQLARPHKSQIQCARNILRLMKGSELVDWDARTNIHSCYSIKCLPQVLGALRESIDHAEQIIVTEMNSATDNPLIFRNKDGVPYSKSGGNFHGQVVGNVLAYLNIALGSTVLKNFNGLVTRIHDDKLSNGLPGMLVESTGLNSGLMIPQYTLASIYNEYKALAYPVVVDSIPTCGMAEDVVSMGTNQARNLWKSVDLCYDALAICVLAVVQGLYFRQKDKLVGFGVGTKKAYLFFLKEFEKKGFLIPYTDSKQPMYEWLKVSRELALDLNILQIYDEYCADKC